MYNLPDNIKILHRQKIYQSNDVNNKWLIYKEITNNECLDVR
jgi:hypothetical protein